MKAHETGIKRIMNAFVYSYQGFCAAFRSEAAFRQDIAFVIIFGAIACWLDVPIFQRACLIFALILILMAELVNTAIETIIDRISEDYHELSKKAKDIGSLLVLISFIGNAVLWLGVLWNNYSRIASQISELF